MCELELEIDINVLKLVGEGWFKITESQEVEEPFSALVQKDQGDYREQLPQNALNLSLKNLQGILRLLTEIRFYPKGSFSFSSEKYSDNFLFHLLNEIVDILFLIKESLVC